MLKLSGIVNIEDSKYSKVTKEVISWAQYVLAAKLLYCVNNHLSTKDKDSLEYLELLRLRNYIKPIAKNNQLSIEDIEEEYFFGPNGEFYVVIKSSNFESGAPQGMFTPTTRRIDLNLLGLNNIQLVDEYIAYKDNFERTIKHELIHHYQFNYSKDEYYYGLPSKNIRDSELYTPEIDEVIRNLFYRKIDLKNKLKLDPDNKLILDEYKNTCLLLADERKKKKELNNKVNQLQQEQSTSSLREEQIDHNLLDVEFYTILSDIIGVIKKSKIPSKIKEHVFRLFVDKSKKNLDNLIYHINKEYNEKYINKDLTRLFGMFNISYSDCVAILNFFHNLKVNNFKKYRKAVITFYSELHKAGLL